MVSPLVADVLFGLMMHSIDSALVLGPGLLYVLPAAVFLPHLTIDSTGCNVAHLEVSVTSRYDVAAGCYGCSTESFTALPPSYGLQHNRDVTTDTTRIIFTTGHSIARCIFPDVTMLRARPKFDKDTVRIPSATFRWALDV
jgi:hypothetical protein